LSLDSLLSGLIFGLPTACRFYGPLKPSADSLADHAALELGKGACNLKHQPFGRRSRIDRLLIEVQISRSPRPLIPASWYSLTTSQPRRSAICFLYAQKRQPQLPAPRIVENGPALE